MKKYLNLILLGCGTLFALLVFATMAGTAMSASVTAPVLGTITSKVTVYETIKADNPYGLAVASLVLVIFVVLAGGASLVLALMNKLKPYNHFIALVAAALALVAGILFFCFTTGDYKDLDLGIGCILSGLFALVSAGAFGAFGVLTLMHKLD